MRITSKGQLTIPQDVREQTGLMPGTDVEVVVEDGAVRIRKTVKAKPDAVDKRIARFAGTGNRRYTTEQLLSLLRGED